MTSQHKTGTHPFYIGMYIHMYTHIYVHIYTSQKECLHIFYVECSPQNGLSYGEELFREIVTEPVKPNVFTEQMFQVKELKAAIGR